MINTAPETLRAANELRLVLYGSILVVVVLLVPGDIFGMMKQRLHRRRVRRRRFGREESLG